MRSASGWRASQRSYRSSNSDSSTVAGNLATDSHLAALALEHGADIVSYDRDFARFPGVQHRLPG